MPSFSPRQALSDLRYGRLNSAKTHKLLSLIYQENRVYPVLFGPLRGMKLRYHRTINLQTMLGLSEQAVFEIILRISAAESASSRWIICDAGANIGTYSLFFSRYLPGSAIYAFEPSPSTVARLKDNLALNRAQNVHVIEKACSDRRGEVEFFIGQSHYMSSMNAQWAGGGQGNTLSVIVHAISLDDFFYDLAQSKGPDFIKMDIEGGGVLALKGCDRCISEKRPLFLIESHTPDEDRAISDLILKHSYDAYRLNDHRWVSAPDQTHPVPNGVWGTLLLWPVEKRSMARRVLGS